jgi:hypothetical protein
MRTVVAYALLLLVLMVGATVFGRFLVSAIDHLVHEVSLILNVN